MTYSYLRYALIALFWGLGMLLHVKLGLSQSWYLYLAGLLLLLSHILFGNVWMAFNSLKRGNPQQAEALLSQVWKPNWLLPRNRAYYFFTLGMLHLQHKKREQAKKYLQKAVSLGLRTPNDHALAQLNLAHIAYIQKDFAKARQALATAQSLQPTDLMIKDNLQKLEAALGRGE
ncbi:MAG: tetratricopeptide repeat protein [Lewinellaceae bacterium]|nr:tetratricopeptide repeat protein [Phaeodactylibacter sp.]MCB9349817.1 tetratricopeptide repeat protein [Lewinellaceae bacterium]